MYTTKMAKLMKNLNPFNRSSGKTKEGPVDTATKKDQDSSTEPSTGDNMNRRRLSISKSGRYRENNKRRSALHHDDDIDKENRCATTDVLMNEKDKKNWENRNKQETLSNNNNINNNNFLDSINNNRNVSSLGRVSSLSNYEGSLDGHAVADEIESLAKTQAMEHNSRILNTDL